MQSVQRLSAVALISALSLLGVVASAAPASAKVSSNETFHDTSSQIDVETCPGLTVRIDSDIEGRLIFNSHGRDGLGYSTETRHGTTTFTNLATGTTVTLITNTVIHDLKVTDNGDGTITVLQADTGITKVEGSIGKLGVKRTGTVRFESLFDASGTLTDRSDDEQLGSEVVRANTGQSDLPRMLCDLLQ
jgi:hypothetical protein